MAVAQDFRQQQRACGGVEGFDDGGGCVGRSAVPPPPPAATGRHHRAPAPARHRTASQSTAKLQDTDPAVLQSLNTAQASTRTQQPSSPARGRSLLHSTTPQQLLDAAAPHGAPCRSSLFEGAAEPTRCSDWGGSHAAHDAEMGSGMQCTRRRRAGAQREGTTLALAPAAATWHERGGLSSHHNSALSSAAAHSLLQSCRRCTPGPGLANASRHES